MSKKPELTLTVAQKKRWNLISYIMRIVTLLTVVGIGVIVMGIGLAEWQARLLLVLFVFLYMAHQWQAWHYQEELGKSKGEISGEDISGHRPTVASQDFSN